MQRTLEKIALISSRPQPGAVRCFRLVNADGKAWVLPVKGMRLAMMLYQPGGIKGKLLKALYPTLHRIPAINRLINAEQLFCHLQPGLARICTECFGPGNVDFAIFEGTPSVHCKATIQFSRNGRILGYCKVSDNPEVRQLFTNEADLLNILAQKGVKDIPRALFCGEYTAEGTSERVYAFVQSTTKTLNSATPHAWGPLHEKFLHDLYEHTSGECDFAETAFAKRLAEAARHPQWMPERHRGLMLRVIDAINARYGESRLVCAASHGDFTPWNTFVEHGRLFVFDWEYADLLHPFRPDRYHFYTQSAIFERHLTAEQIIAQAPAGTDAKEFALYLIDIMTRYTLREKGRIGDGLAAQFDIWAELLSHYENSLLSPV